MKKLTIDRRWLVGWVVCLALGTALALWTVRRMGERLLVRDAEHTALQYAHYLGATVPGLDALFAGAPPGADTLRELHAARALGDVFRFKLFDAQGRALLASDDLDHGSTQAGPGAQSLGVHQAGSKSHVADIVLAGHNHVELKDGTGKPDRPALYSEAYVPLRAGDRVLGVIEVYVDQVARAARIHQAFLHVSALVGALLLAVGAFGVAHWAQHQRERRHAEERVRYLAQHDVLSGALNRTSFTELLTQAAWRHGEGGPGFAVLCIDLDCFKDVNDALGHAAGDEVLRQATQRLRQLVRHGDEVARLGGDEFAILQSGVADTGSVATFARRIVEGLSEPYEVAGRRVPSSASVGAAIVGIDAATPQDLMHKADLALYRAKAHGRGSFSFYDAVLDAKLEERRELARDLHEAVEAEALTVHYQPLYDADGQTLLGYEALLRWTHATRGAVPPAVFIPLAEDTGLIDVLGRWVLRRACAQAATWPHPLSLSVNLSAAQFRDEGLVQTVADALVDAHLPPQRLELEITESLLMSNTEGVVRMLHALSAMGVRIAMDDFGTGYSSLAYLWRFPFDKVKIDRAFTQGLSDDGKVELIVRSIISLAHSLGIRVNAEGVESELQLIALQKLGCDEMQGFLLGRPAAPETLTHGRSLAAAPARAAPRASAFGALRTRPAAL